MASSSSLRRPSRLVLLSRVRPRPARAILPSDADMLEEIGRRAPASRASLTQIIQRAWRLLPPKR